MKSKYKMHPHLYKTILIPFTPSLAKEISYSFNLCYAHIPFPLHEPNHQPYKSVTEKIEKKNIKPILASQFPLQINAITQQPISTYIISTIRFFVSFRRTVYLMVHNSICTIPDFDAI